MNTCKKCGAQVDENVKFCTSCGEAIIPDEAQAQPEQNDYAAKFQKLNDTPDTTAEFEQADIEKNKAMAVLAYIIFLIPLLAAKDSRFARFHTNQGLVLFIGAISASIVSAIPIIGWILSPILALAVTVLSVIGIINSAGGKAKELPLIGKFKILK